MISFVIPAYNEENLIADCLFSIIKDAHTGRVRFPFEMIVVDNNCTDHTPDIAREYGAIVVKEVRKGTSWARQAGLEAAKYDLVAFIDADSQIPEGWINIAYESLLPDGVVAVSGPHYYRDLPLIERMIVSVFYCFAKVLHVFWPTINGANFIVKKQYLQAAGGFDTAIIFYGDDTAIARRLSTVGKVKFRLDMFEWSSSRRFEAEGLVKTGFVYILNYFWVWLTGRPFTKTHEDVRL
jgi:glycosyltransferase involved in cell wall biosynthesis